MANIMSMVKLKNSTSRNAFDIGRKNAFTAKVGELLPVACIECIPGDSIKGRVQHFTRTMPVNTAAYTRVREYYDWFFVPTNLLWNKFNTFITQMKDNVQHAYSIITNDVLTDTHPYFTTQQLHNYIREHLDEETDQNMFGFKRGELTAKLLNYLGYGDFTPSLDLNNTSSPYRANVNLNPFPLLAYQKIYQDYFRNSQWEMAYAPSFNLDYVHGTNDNYIDIGSLVHSITTPNSHYNMLDLRYCNWNKDKFMGILPNAQYGAASMVDSSSSEGFLTFDDTVPFTTNLYVRDSSDSSLSVGNSLIVKGQSAVSNSIYTVGQANNSNQFRFYLSKEQLSQLRSALGLSSNSNTVNVSTAFSILALRQAEALQKWKEITQSQQQDYKSQIEAHFGVSMSDAYSERCRYIDGSVSNLDISEVTNTNITGDNGADIAGKGIGVGDGSMNFKTDVHGYLMCIYHAVPLLDYAVTGINRTNQKTKVTDYAIPEFDKTGMVSVPTIELTNSVKSSDFTPQLLGYAPRYYEYKTAIDEVHGSFTGDLSHWVAPVSDDYIKTYLKSVNSIGSVNYVFFKVNPATLNPIFTRDVDSSVSTDQLLVNANFEITAVRNLDRNGLPY